MKWKITLFNDKVVLVPMLRVGLHTRDSIEQGMGSHAGAWEPEKQDVIPCPCLITWTAQHSNLFGRVKSKYPRSKDVVLNLNKKHEVR